MESANWRTKPSALRRAAPWLFGPVLLAATGVAVAVVLVGPDELLGWVIGALVAAGLAWVLVSSLFPAKADRVCPACGADRLARTSPDALQGLRCEGCGWRDDDASAFLLAEEEGPLEDAVLRERRRRRGRRRRSVVESSPRSD